MNDSVATVIVTYNSGRVIGRCLRSLNGLGEIAVVDNDSRDDTCRRVEEFAPEVRLIRNAENRGFAAAVNQGIAATSSPFVLLLNPDTVLRTSLEPMVRECLSPRVGAVGGRLIDALGSAQVGFNVRSFPSPLSLVAEMLLLNRLWPGNPVNRRYRRLDFDPDQKQDVDQPAGAFLLLRRDVLDAVGYLDENFFPLWFEDVDLCWRIQQAGYIIRYEPQSVAEHQGAHSLPAMSLERKYLAWYGSLLRFAGKYFSPPSCLTVWAAAYLGLLMRWWACVLQAGSREERRAYGAALRFVASRRPHRDASSQVDVRNTAESRSS